MRKRRGRAQRITFQRFKSQLARVRKVSEDELAEVWRAMDPDCTGYVPLRRYHLESHEVKAVRSEGLAWAGGCQAETLGYQWGCGLV